MLVEAEQQQPQVLILCLALLHQMVVGKEQQIPLREATVVRVVVGQTAAVQELEILLQHPHPKEIMAEPAEVQMALEVVEAEQLPQDQMLDLEAHLPEVTAVLELRHLYLEHL